jgi:adenylate cyclase
LPALRHRLSSFRLEATLKIKASEETAAVAPRDGSDVVIDPTEARRQLRHRWARVGLPIAGVGLIIAAILGIAWYSYETNKRDALQLADEVIASQEQRISREVDAYLGPAPRAVELLRGVLSDGVFLGTAQGAAEAIGWQILFDNSQLALISYANTKGSFMMVKREPSGSIDTKVIDREDGGKQVTWTRRDRVGRTVLVEEDPSDTYDPRTRVWYTGAIAAKGKVFWSSLYIFFTDQKPGITVSEALFDAEGRPVAVFGVDIALDSLSEFLAKLPIGKTGRAMIVDGDGRVIAFPDVAKTFRRVGNDLQPMLLSEIGDPILARAYNHFRIEGFGRRTIEVDGERFITAATPVLGGGSQSWSTLIVVPERDFVGFVALNNRSTLLMSFGVVLLSALFAALLINQGLRADRNAELVVAREQAREAQSRAFTELAANAALFDPTQEDALQALTKIAARTVMAKRAAIWRVSHDANSIVLEDCRDRENDGHTAGVEYARTEMPAFFTAMEAGDEIEARDAAKDARTAEFHGLYLKPMGSKALIAVPIRKAERWVGIICFEDWRAEGALSFARAVANMLSVRFAAGIRGGAVGSTQAAAGGERRSVAALAAVPHASPAPTRAMRRAQLGDARARKLALQTEETQRGGGTVAAQVFPHATVCTLQFTDAMSLAETHQEDDHLAAVDRIARSIESIAGTLNIEYVKMLGDKVVLADGFSDDREETAAVVIADAAIEIRERAARLFTGLGHRLEFRLGIDTGTIIGAPIGVSQSAYNIWGEAVRTSELMADSGLPGSIVVTETTYRLLRERYVFRVRGSFYLGGAGEMSTYLLVSRI